MTQARAYLETFGSLSRFAAHLRPLAPEMVREIILAIEREVPSYAPRHGERRRKLIGAAVQAAIERFIDTLGDQPSSGPRVDDLFRKMGYGEATDGHSLEAMRSALDLAHRHAWGALRDFAVDNELSAATLGWIGDALLGYMSHLNSMVQQGHAWGLAAAGNTPESAHTALIEALLSGQAGFEVQGLASVAGWEPLPEVVVIVARDPLPDVEFADTVLSDRDRERPLLITAPGHAEALERQLHRADPGLDLAISWPVPLDKVRQAHQWADRVHDLVDRSVIPHERTVHCLEHTTQIWLHSEPALRRRLTQDLLRPLMAESPNSREILSETLLVWLETRDSAPTIAAILDIHPQTVRYRWKRINELFGDALHDPESILKLTMILKASLPLWKAGDQSDFERFRAGGQL